MQYRKFGRTGWQVSEIAYGMWGMGDWTGSDDQESMHSLERAVQLGCNFFDTAWAYGDGHSETLLGQLLSNHAEKRLYAATKIPPKNLQWPARREYPLEDVFPAASTAHVETPKRGSIQNCRSTQAVKKQREQNPIRQKVSYQTCCAADFAMPSFSNIFSIKHQCVNAD
jgi:aryl-alcohol dehydrogenase-like predicted oxidoreductase